MSRLIKYIIQLFKTETASANEGKSKGKVIDLLCSVCKHNGATQGKHQDVWTDNNNNLITRSMHSMFWASAARCKCFQIALSTADFKHKL